MNTKQQNIYNCFLKHFRNGQPFQPRKDFTKMDINTLTTISKLSNFFDKFPQIDWNEYFGSPRALHPDEDCPYIDFFLTRAAIKNYNLFKDKKELEKPENQMEDIKKGMHFIGIFSLKKNIPLTEYINHKDGLMYSWMQHYREHNINPYCLMELGDVFSTMYNLQPDEKELYIKDLPEKFGNLKMQYSNSTEVKRYVKEATFKISKFVEFHLKK